LIDFINFQLITVCIFAFAAGFVDSIAGGGGLIQLPAILSFMPSLSIPTAIGINKFSGFIGTSTAAVQYSKKIKINWKILIPAIVSALIFSLLGAMLVVYFNKVTLKPFVFGMLILVFLYTIISKHFGIKDGKTPKSPRILWFSWFTGMGMGFYDGFFGPATGSFLILIFVSVFGFDFIHSAAYAKIINAFTNLSALIYFVITGTIIYKIAVPMAAFNMAGSYFGSKMAISKGNNFVRTFYISIVTILILKFGYEIFF
jgi:uncharacterized membrane protein YfcA